jgi:hypothetical protein
MWRKKGSLIIIFLFATLVGCAGVSVHDNLKIPSGTIEGNQFTGIRYPFKVSVPPHRKMSTEFPDFLKELGYDEPGPYDKEVAELYIFNPSTQSNIQIDFTPGSPRAKFSQDSIEAITTMATGSLEGELEKYYGKEVKVEIGPTTPFSLSGIRFAAKKYATYTLKGVKREQGWIYGFTDHYQMFILYMVLEKEGSNDREDMKKIFDSFEFISQK